jgi:hypothetical protein
MDTGTVALVAIAVAAGGLVQASGFALVSAPVISCGTGTAGIVNALSIVEPVGTDGGLARPVRRMPPSHRGCRPCCRPVRRHRRLIVRLGRLAARRAGSTSAAGSGVWVVNTSGGAR